MHVPDPDRRHTWRLLQHSLQPHARSLFALGGILVASIAVQIATPFVASRFINEVTTSGDMQVLVRLALATMVLALVGQIMSIAETWFAERVSWDATNALRRDLVAHVLRLDRSFHIAHSPGELIERVDGDVGTLARFFSRFVVSVVGNGLLMIGILVLLYAVDWRIGVGLTAFVGIALVLMLRIRSGSTHQWAAERQGSADFYGLLGDYLGGLEDIRSSGATSFVHLRFNESMRHWLRVIREAQMRGYTLVATSQGFFGLGTAFALAICAMLFRSNDLTLGAVYLVFRYTGMLREPTEQLRNEIQELQQADASAMRIERLLNIAPAIVDPEHPVSALPPGAPSVTLDSVTFGYGEGDILRDVSVSIAPGAVLGVIGRTGSGKTSLIRLVPRFHDPDRGTVKVGGVDVRKLRLGDLRSRIGIVSQDIHIFHATVRENLTLFDDTVDDARVMRVLADVGLDGWLGALPRGLDTGIGGTGGGLSAGQAQLLTSARILLRDPGIVILDEASSRLDPATERHLQIALGNLLRNRTGIVIAHRLETLALVDDILLLEGGRVAEHGKRVELAANPDSRYAALLRAGTSEVLR